MKTLESYKKLYRQKYPNLSDKQITELAKAAMAKDAQNTSANDTPPTFGETTVGGDTSKRGVRVGFGLTDKDGNDLYLMPGLFPQFMTTLSVKNPKAYNTILTNVFQATGTKYRDPNTLGTWLESAGRNLLASSRQDPTAASISIEALVNAGTVNRGAAGIFATTGAPAQNIPTRQIYDVPKVDVQADIDSDIQKLLGRTASEEDRAQSWYKDLTKTISKMYSQGIVTKTKVQVNPETGKKENVVVQTPGYSKEKISQLRTEAIKAADPEAVDRMARISVYNKYILGGGQG